MNDRRSITAPSVHAPDVGGLEGAAPRVDGNRRPVRRGRDELDPVAEDEHCVFDLRPRDRGIPGEGLSGLHGLSRCGMRDPVAGAIADRTTLMVAELFVARSRPRRRRRLPRRRERRPTCPGASGRAGARTPLPWRGSAIADRAGRRRPLRSARRSRSGRRVRRTSPRGRHASSASRLAPDADIVGCVRPIPRAARPRGPAPPPGRPPCVAAISRSSSPGVSRRQTSPTMRPVSRPRAR